MQVILNEEEAWSLMSVVTSYVIDKGGMSQDGKQAVRRWRTDRAAGTVAMGELAEGLNDALAEYFGERTARTVKRKGRNVKKVAR
jgi:hypothetical protein